MAVGWRSSPTVHAEAAPPVELDEARAYIASQALRPGTIGRVGLELERLVVDRRQPAALVGWRRLQAATADLRLPAGSRLSFEPGGQVELSTEPRDDVATAVAALQADDAALRAAIEAAGLHLLGVGLDPVRAPVRINPADRYRAMASYFGASAFMRDGAAMMCSTASLQINLEAGPPVGWADRIAHIHRLSPALAALGAASPLAGGRVTGFRSSRQAVWSRLDPGRCSPFPGHGDPAGAWVAFALAAPVMFVARPGGLTPMREHVPLVDWLSGRRPLDGRRPSHADIDLHLTTLWPPLRLRGWLELRVLDSVPSRWWPGLAALVAVMVDDPAAADHAAAAVEPVDGRWERATRLGIADPMILTAVRRLLAAALPAVPEPVRAAAEDWAELIEAGRTPADLVLGRARQDGPRSCLIAEELS
jgi:glutamate--cysteine ligase